MCDVTEPWQSTGWNLYDWHETIDFDDTSWIGLRQSFVKMNRL